MSKFSSYKNQQLLTESWRNFLFEVSDIEADEDDEQGKADSKTLSHTVDLGKYGSEGFCKINPKINAFAKENADNFGETILFVFGTMQTSWNIFAPLFRFIPLMVNKIDKQELENYQTPPLKINVDEFLKNKINELSNKLKSDPTEEQAIKQKQFIQSLNEQAETIIYELGKNSSNIDLAAIKAYNKEKKKKSRMLRELESYLSDVQGEYRLPILEKVYKNYKNIGDSELNEEQKEFLKLAANALAFVMSVPDSSYYKQVWDDRQKYYDAIVTSGLLDKATSSSSGEEIINATQQLLFECLKIPGLASAKAGFLVQLISGRLGCIDSIWTKVFTNIKNKKDTIDNLKKIANTKKVDKIEGDNKKIEYLIKYILDSKVSSTSKQETQDKNRLKDAIRYIKLLNYIEEQFSLTSEDLWNAWTEIVSYRLRNPGMKTLDLKITKDGKVVLEIPGGSYFYRGKGIASKYELTAEDLKDIVAGSYRVTGEHYPPSLGLREHSVYEGAQLDDGTPVCPACLEELLESQRTIIQEAKYQGRTVTLNKPMKGDVKKFKVYVKDPKTGNVKKVNFGDPNMRIKKSNPKRRKSFRARHHCDTNPGPKTKARYWSCRKW